MSYKTIAIKNNVSELLEEAKEEYLKHHPEFKEIPISNNKILFEVLEYYLK